MDKRKRMLWLFNHTSLRKTQVPMLIDMGYEVYCPKIYSYEWGDYSASVSYDFDSSLTLPPEVLEELNDTDFYSPLTFSVMQIINSYFDVIFSVAIPEIVERFLVSYSGTLVVQGYGLLGNLSCTELLSYSFNNSTRLGILDMIKKRRNNFWLALGYRNLKETEALLLQNCSLYMPIELVDAVPQNKWKGGDNRIVFVCPKIRTNKYYEKVYREFCNDFGDLPHIIGGRQMLAVEDDKNVTGFLPDDKYIYNMTHLAAMFYHSQEPRHIHYHPLEAIKWGMPLIFMAGGMLDHLGGINLPGRATSVADARKKLKRLLMGDNIFIKKVTKSQEVLLQSFNKDYCRRFWEVGMRKIESALIIPGKKRRIAVIMPAPYIGGVYDYAIRFCINLQEEIQIHRANVELIFAYPKNELYAEKDYFSILKKRNIQVREFIIETKDRKWIEATLELAGYQPRINKLSLPDTVTVLRDGMRDFGDCDYAFFMSDSVGMKPLFFLCPYTMVVHDYIQRYVPEAVSAEADRVKCYNQRQASSLFVTSEPTRQDAINHGCIDPERVILSPPLISFPEFNRKSGIYKEKTYFLWSTNAAPHKNHLRALDALELYYQQGGALECVITGAFTQYFKPKASLTDAPVVKEYIRKIQKKIEKCELLCEHISIKGNMPKITYEKLLHGACFAFHPGYGDNGNFTVTDAASLGVPSLASDYPAMRYLADYAGIKVRYFDPFDIDSIVDGLHEMEQKYIEMSNQLPEADVLNRKSFSYQAERLYQLIRKQIAFDEEM